MAIKKEIVLINQDSGYLMIDIANAFAADGWKCSVIAGRLVERNNRLNSSITFHKITHYERRTTFKRLFTWSCAFIEILFILLLKYRNKHVLIASNPPFAPFLPLFCRNRFSLLILDIYPDILTELAVISKDSMVATIWSRLNRYVFNKADNIYTITDGMASVLQTYAGSKPVKTIPVWTDSSFLKPLEKKDNPFVQQYGLAGKFVVLYSGNFGYTHDLEALIDIAARIDNNNILFLLIGDGDKKKVLQDKIHELGLGNCMMLPFQDPSILPFSLSSADLAVVTIGQGSSRLSVPSKTYNFLSVGAPLLCIADHDSELSRLVDKYDVGTCFSGRQLDEAVAFINMLETDLIERKRLKDNSLSAAAQFSPDHAYRYVTERS